MTENFFKWFPIPHFLEMPAAGLDFLQGKARFISLKKTSRGFRVDHFGEEDNVPLGDPAELSNFLSNLSYKNGITFVNATLPEESAYLFVMSLPFLNKKDIRGSIESRLEEFVPISASEAVFDYIILSPKAGHFWTEGENIEVSVSVLPRQSVYNHLQIFKKTPLTPLSFEIEGQAIARAVIKKGDKNTFLLVHIGMDRTGFYIARNGVVVFSSSVDIGENVFKKNISNNEFHHKEDKRGGGAEKNLYNSQTKLAEVLTTNLSPLRDEILKLDDYWRNKSDGDVLDCVIFSGNSAAQIGFSDYFSSSLPMKVELANVWTNICDFEDYVPPITFERSLGFAPAVGLALARYV